MKGRALKYPREEMILRSDYRMDYIENMPMIRLFPQLPETAVIVEDDANKS